MYWTSADQHAFNSDRLVQYAIYSLLKQIKFSSVFSFYPTWTNATACLLAVHSLNLTDWRKFRTQLHDLPARKNKQNKRPCPIHSSIATLAANQGTNTVQNFHALLQWNHRHWTIIPLWTSPSVHFLKRSPFLHRHIIMIIIYPLTTRVVGAPQMVSQPVSSISPSSPLPFGTWRTPNLYIPWCCPPTSFSVFLVFFPLPLCLARWFWPDLMNGRHDLPLQFTSLYHGQEAFLWCLLGLGTNFLVGKKVFVWDA